MATEGNDARMVDVCGDKIDFDVIGGNVHVSFQSEENKNNWTVMELSEEKVDEFIAKLIEMKG